MLKYAVKLEILHEDNDMSCCGGCGGDTDKEVSNQDENKENEQESTQAQNQNQEQEEK